ncbi:MAG: histidine--tRNA ligase [Rickettsiaceae bacterium]|nr:histidine--tRNA ligase [Rickettsiaceae bacterium]
MTLRPVRGTKDILPEDYYLFNKIINSAQKIANRYCFENYSTPIFEYTKVFDRTLGETSDVVNKEMYSFTDRNGDSITLRPEFTASIVRSVISEGLLSRLPLKLFSFGPLFRYDRPQAGRQRQFHQINFEILGETSYSSDAEMVKIGYDILKELGIEEDVRIEINSLGSTDTRNSYNLHLKEFFKKYESSLSEESKSRLDKNPMRILDSKNPEDQKIVASAPKISEFYDASSKERFEKSQEMLSNLNIPFEVNPRLVRGLDYYCHTAFEYVTSKIGAQSSVGGGGRYDGLAKILSDKEIPAVGFACGIERLMLLLKDKYIYKKSNIVILPITESEVNHSYFIAAKLREFDIPVNIFETGKVGKRIERASKEGARYAIFIGENEAQSSMYKIKDLASGDESCAHLEKIIQKFKEEFQC